MGIKDTVSAARLLIDCMVLEKTDFARVTHTPSKTVLLSPDDGPFLPFAEPADAGMDGERLLAFAKEASESREGETHAVVVLSHGRCVFEAARAGYATDMPHATFSMCKTLTGLAIGMLIDDGRLKLTSSVISFFPEYKAKLAKSKAGQLRIFHLLEMSTGNPFNEAGVVTSDNYVRSYFETALRGEPGESFSYNSMNSYILATIVTRVSGETLAEFLDKRLFAPLGIQNYFWEKSKDGVEKGGWGLYLSTRSMAKIGQLFLEEGEWEGKRIISKEFLATMTEKHKSVPSSIGMFDYGYHIWRHKRNNSYLLNGMLGQNVWVVPSRKLVVAITAGDDCIFQDSAALVAAMRHLRPAAAHDTQEAKEARAWLSAHFGEYASFTPPYISEESRDAEERLFPSLLGRFLAEKNNGGILPLMTRLVQNNPTRGITSVTVAKGKAKNTLVFTFTEGRASYRITAGNTRFLPSTHIFHGEPYRVAAAYSLGMNAEREPFLRLELRFPELASTRRMLFIQTTEGFELRMAEKPGYPFVEKMTRSLPSDGNALLGAITKARVPVDLALKYTRRAFLPTLSLKKAEDMPPEEPKAAK